MVSRPTYGEQAAKMAYIGKVGQALGIEHHTKLDSAVSLVPSALTDLQFRATTLRGQHVEKS